MSDEAQPPVKPRRPRKPSPKSGARSAARAKAKDAATGETVASPRAPASLVPEIPAVIPAAAGRHASPVRLGILTTTLALLIGSLAWFSDAPELSRSEPAQLASSLSGSDDPRLPQTRQGLDQELRLAALALELRENQESLTRLRDDARSLAASIGTLAGGIDALKSDVDGVRTGAAAGLARVQERLDHIELANVPDPIPLGDPALQNAMLLGDPALANTQPLVAQANTATQPATTGGLPDIQAPPQASVKVSFAKPKPRVRAPKPIDGWLVHHVRDELALVENNGAHFEVRTGELLPDAGIVRSIKKRGEHWVVLTTKGIITEHQ
jgi:hypothetical protein